MKQTILDRAARGILSAGLLATAAGCVHAVTVQIPNPTRTGSVIPNRIPNPDDRTASHFGLPPGTFTSEASLVSVDAQGHVVANALRVDGHQRGLAGERAGR